MQVKIAWKDRLTHWFDRFGFDVFACCKDIHELLLVTQGHKQLK